MKIFLVGIWIFLAVASSFAGEKGEKSVTGLIGFSQSSLGFGVNYENKISQVLGLGGYFLHSSEKKDGNKNQVISFGGSATAHLIDNNDFEMTMGPGFGIIMIKGQTGTLSTDDQTTFGPSWKMGFLFKTGTQLKLGLEQTELINWFAEKAPGHFSYTNFALNFAF